MVTISFTQLRQNAKTYFDAVENGQVIRVQRHGKIIAEIIPSNKKEHSSKNKSVAMLIPGVSLSRAILEERKQNKR